MPVEILFSLSRHIFRAGKMCQTEEHQKLTLNATWFHVCKKMFSISRPNVTQYCNPYTALTCVFNPALNKLQWKDHGGARPAPLPVVAWLWKRTGSSDARYPYFKISQRRILLSEFMSWCLGPAWKSLYLPQRQKYQGLCSPECTWAFPSWCRCLCLPPAPQHSWPPRFTVAEVTSTRQGYILFTLLNVFSSFVQCPCFPIIKLNCSLNSSLSPWLFPLYPPHSKHFSTASTVKSPPVFLCYHSLPVNSPRSNDPFMSSLPWWKIPLCPAVWMAPFVLQTPVCCAERWFILQGFTRWLPGSNGFRSLSPKGKWEAVTSMWKPHSILWAAWALAVILLTWTGLWNSAVPGWLILDPREVKPQLSGRWLLPSAIW